MAEYDLQEVEEVFTSETDLDINAPTGSGETLYDRTNWFIAAPMSERREGEKDLIREILSWWWGRVFEVGEFYLRGAYYRDCPGVVEGEDVVEAVLTLRGSDIDTSFFVLFYDEEGNQALLYYGGLWRSSYYFDDVREFDRILL